MDLPSKRYKIGVSIGSGRALQGPVHAESKGADGAGQFKDSSKISQSRISMEEKVVYEFDGFHLDPKERLLVRDGKGVDLTPKAFDMLLVFVENGKHLLARHELKERVWLDAHVEDHNIDVTIGMLRKTLGRDQRGNQYIETVPKKGYRFSAAVQVKGQRANLEHPPGSEKDTQESSDVFRKAYEEPGLTLVAQLPIERPSAQQSFGRRLWRIGAWIFVCVGLFLGVGIVIMRFVGLPPYPTPLSPQVLTHDGLPKGNLRTDGTTLYFNESRWFRTMVKSMAVSGGTIHTIETRFPNVWLQDLSNDGKTLLITSIEDIRHRGRLWTIPAQGGKPQEVGTRPFSFARWSPDNSRIACADLTEVMMMDADGTSLHPLAAMPSPVAEMGWNQDGERLWVIVDEAKTHVQSLWEIVVKQDGTAEPAQKLSFDPGTFMYWTWTPDKALVYAKLDFVGASHLMRSDGGSLADVRAVPLATEIGKIESLVSARSDDRLYLAINSDSSGETLKYDVGDGKWQAFVLGLSAIYVAFSPDGQWIVYVNTLDGCLWLSQVDGTGRRRLTQPPMVVEAPSWSPDGRRIAFTGKAPGKLYRIYLINADGSAMKEASEGDDNQGGPSWSPDGQELVYGNVSCQETGNCLVWRLNLATRNTKFLPQSHGLRTARWSPDGKYIAALRWETHEVMLFNVHAERWRKLADGVTGDNILWSPDSQYIVVNNFGGDSFSVENLRIEGGHRLPVLSTLPLEIVPGKIDGWIGLTPDGGILVHHAFTAGEIYELKLNR